MNSKANKNPVLSVNNLSAGYNGNVVLSHISFSVSKNEIRMIMGGSGCGKSTLLNTILGLLPIIEGSVEYFGTHQVTNQNAIQQDVRERCGVLFQNGALLSTHTVAENVALPIINSFPGLSLPIVHEIVAQKLNSVHMLESWNKYPSELSGGMRKRAAIARALSLDPELLLCDEPSAGLDPASARSLDDLLLEIRDLHGIAIVVVTHELQSIQLIANTLLFVANQKVVFDGSLDEGLNSEIEEVKHFFSRTADLGNNINSPLNFQIREPLYASH